MRISRLYTATRLLMGKTLELQASDAHYVKNVLRLRKQQMINLFNAEDGEFQCKIIEVSRHALVVNILQPVMRNNESPLKIYLGLGISRGDRMDWAIQKAVELGVNQVTPLITERCVVKFKANKKQQRFTHWQNIIRHASEQCQRVYLPDLNEVTRLADWVRQQQGLCLFLDPHIEPPLSSLTPHSQTITLLTGPEGGFSQTERELATAAGFTPARLGKRILRAETATLAALTAIQTLWGDF